MPGFSRLVYQVDNEGRGGGGGWRGVRAEKEERGGGRGVGGEGAGLRLAHRLAGNAFSMAAHSTAAEPQSPGPTLSTELKASLETSAREPGAGAAGAQPWRPPPRHR